MNTHSSQSTLFKTGKLVTELKLFQLVYNNDCSYGTVCMVLTEKSIPSPLSIMHVLCQWPFEKKNHSIKWQHNACYAPPLKFCLQIFSYSLFWLPIFVFKYGSCCFLLFHNCYFRHSVAHCGLACFGKNLRSSNFVYGRPFWRQQQTDYNRSVAIG